MSFSFLFLGCLSLEAASLWPFKSGTFRHTSQNMNVLYQFGEKEDVVHLSSPAGEFKKEIFRGKLERVGFSAEDLKRVKKKIRPSVLERVLFFETNMGEGVSAFFGDGERSHLLYAQKGFGFSHLILNKTYDQPSAVRAFQSLGSGGRRHYQVSVDPFRPSIKEGPYDITWDILKNSAHLYYDVLVRRLQKEKQSQVLQALKEITARSARTELQKMDIENLQKLDSYIMDSQKVDGGGLSEIQPFRSEARSLRDALEMRLLGFGLEPNETWLLQYDPLIQDLDDFEYLHDPKISKGAFVRTDRGLLVMRSVDTLVRLNEYQKTDHVFLTFSYPSLGISQGDLYGLKISTVPKDFDEHLLFQKQKGLQGNSSYYKNLLQDVLFDCSHLLRKGPL